MTKIEELQQKIADAKGKFTDDADLNAVLEKRIKKYETELADLEASENAPAGKGSAKKTTPKAPKKPKEPETEGGEGDDDGMPTGGAGKWKPDNTKGEEELSCEKMIRDAKAERKKNNQDGLIKIIQTQKRSTKGEFSKEKLAEKTVAELRVMAGFSKPRGEKLLDDAQRAIDAYSKVPVKSFVKKAETPEKQKEVAEKAAQLQEKYAKEIANFVKEKELELKNELENLLK